MNFEICNHINVIEYPIKNTRNILEDDFVFKYEHPIKYAQVYDSIVETHFPMVYKAIKGE